MELEGLVLRMIYAAGRSNSSLVFIKSGADENMLTIATT